MAESTIVFPENASSQPGFERFESLLTVKDLKQRYLHGVDLKDNVGKNLSRAALVAYINTAISMAEHDYEITLTPTQYIDEKHDYKADDYWNWNLIQLKHKPVISVEHYYLRITSNTPMTEFPESWIRLENMTGQLQLAPISGSIGEFNIGNVTLMPRILIFNDTFPALFQITYTAGFEQNRVPYLINQAIGLTAALLVLSIAGDLVVGAGIANASLSIDGLSQSIGTTASAMYSAYSARMEFYNNQLKKIDKILKKYYGKRIKHSVV